MGLLRGPSTKCFVSFFTWGGSAPQTPPRRKKQPGQSDVRTSGRLHVRTSGRPDVGMSRRSDVQRPKVRNVGTFECPDVETSGHQTSERSDVRFYINNH